MATSLSAVADPIAVIRRQLEDFRKLPFVVTEPCELRAPFKQFELT